MTIDDIVRGLKAIYDLLVKSDQRSERYDRQLDFLQRLAATQLVSLSNTSVKIIPGGGYAGLPDPDGAALIFRNTRKHPVAVHIKAQRTAVGGLPADPFFFIGPKSFRYDGGTGVPVRPQRYWMLDTLEEITLIVRPDESVYVWKPGVSGAAGWLTWSLLDPESMWELNQGEGVAQR